MVGILDDLRKKKKVNELLARVEAKIEETEKKETVEEKVDSMLVVLKMLVSELKGLLK
mgnify:CR=1 FL=1